MNEDEIKTAAEKYLSSDEPHYFQDPCDLDVRDAFIAGAKWILEQAYSKGTLSDWYQASIDNTIPPIWTDKHINELSEDFYCIRK